MHHFQACIHPRCFCRSVFCCSRVALVFGVFGVDVAGWQGPLSLIWQDCEEAGVVAAADPTACTKNCTSTSGCNAINFNTDAAHLGASCQLRACSKPLAPTWSVPYWRGYAHFQVPPTPAPKPTPVPPPSPAPLVKVELTDAAARDGAVCLDGSAPVYYFRPGFGSGAKSYILFLEGGGWCAGLADAVGGFDSCLSRSGGGLGSSKGYGPTMAGGEASVFFNSDPAVNTRFHNWNHIAMVPVSPATDRSH